ncbi:MAG: SDR family NAD(P)-dependent oxidoreductase [Azonexus sp.]|nr:SDR family NAD(P)-dependent oxidoreductase [Azonexus sp.]
MLGYDKQVALISGAGRGIGRQHALFLASRGAKVVVNDYGGGLRGENGGNPAPADNVVAEIAAAGGTAMSACNDITDPAQVKAMVDATVTRFGRLDIVIHNASVYAPLGSFQEARIEDLDRILRVNVHGGWNIVHAAWPYMLANHYGRVVVTGSGAGFFGRRKDHAYSIAKSALMAFTKVLATEGEAQGIKANLVGPIAWTENSKLQGIPPLMEHFAPAILVSNLVAVLAHEACPVNGEMFHCGGGFTSRVFVGETDGTVFDAASMTPEAVLAGMGAIMDTADYSIPASSDRSGAHLSAAIAAANPAFAEALAKAKHGR